MVFPLANVLRRRPLSAGHTSSEATRGQSPSPAGVQGRRRGARAVPATMIVALVAAASCAQPGQNQVLPIVVVGLSAQLAPVFQGEEDVVYQVTAEVPFPMKAPEGDDAEELEANVPPYPREPFLKDSDARVRVRYVLTNLDDAPRTVELLLDPWNEFARYRPAISAVGENEELVIDFSGYDRFIDLPAKGRIEGVITEEDTRELAVDLATVMAIQASPPPADATESAGVLMNRAMNQQNRSSGEDPLLAPYVPAVIAGLTGFDLGLRSREALNVAVEVQVDVRARDQKYMVEPGKDDARLPAPPGQVITPPRAAAP